MNRQRIIRAVRARCNVMDRRTPTAFHPSARGCRSRHAAEATRGMRSPNFMNPNGVLIPRDALGAWELMQPRWGWLGLMDDSQGNACRATLGWMMERRWRSSSVRSAIFVDRPSAIWDQLRRSGMARMMPPLRGWGLFLDAGFYKDAAPTGLRQTYRPPGEILKTLGELEAEIQRGMKELEGMLK